MNSVWEMRYRLLHQQLERLTHLLSGAQPTDLATIVEHTVRLLATITTLLQQHHVDKHGRCGFCGWTRWRFWRRRPQCTVYRAVDFALDQNLDVVWWKLLNNTGHKQTLEQVRKRLAEQAHAAHQSDGDEDEPTIVMEIIQE